MNKMMNNEMELTTEDLDQVNGGFGYGYGSALGYGYGYGSALGYGYGYGYGNASGYGYGFGSDDSNRLNFVPVLLSGQTAQALDKTNSAAYPDWKKS